MTAKVAASIFSQSRAIVRQTATMAVLASSSLSATS
jgi:hypothetical protein